MSLITDVQNMVAFIKCTVRIAGNYYKCVIFYFLDILKYCLLFLPVLLYSFQTKVPVKTVFAQINEVVTWSDGIQYDCYRCKKKKTKKKQSYWDQLKEQFTSGKGDDKYMFFTFMVIVFGICGVASFFFGKALLEMSFSDPNTTPTITILQNGPVVEPDYANMAKTFFNENYNSIAASLNTPIPTQTQTQTPTNQTYTNPTAPPANYRDGYYQYPT